MKNILDISAILGAKYLLFVAIGIALFYFFKQPKDKQRQMSTFGLLVLSLSYVLAKIASHFYYDARPFVAGHFTPLIAHIADNGFPSDHTLLTAAVAAIICYFDKKLGAILFVLAFLVGAARVYAGVHHIADVIGSIVIAIAAAYIVSLFFQRLFLSAVSKR
jgi:undecaprenyl-diphosphatase